MGGKSQTAQQTQSQSSPWSTAVPDLTGILGQVGGMIGNTGLNPSESGAIGGLLGNAGYSNQFLPGATSLTSNLLQGGGANDQAGRINSAYQNYATNLQPFTNPAYLDPRNTPGFSDAMRTMGDDIRNQVNGMFAGAGRDLSGQNLQALGRGETQGLGGLIANQYNQNANNYLSATGNLYNAGGATGGLLSGLQQQYLANQQAGLGTAQQSQGLANAPYMQQLAAEAQARGIPLSYLQGLTGIAQPIAGLGGQNSSSSSGTNTASGAQQFAQITGGLGALFGGAGRAAGAV